MSVETLSHPSDSALGGAHEHASHATPLKRLRRVLWNNRSDMVVLLVYIFVTGLLSLATPLAAQALVNTVAQGILPQQLVVLTLVLLVGLTFAGIMILLQITLVEILQQRIFARTALQLAYRIPRIRNSALANEYAPELINRFFDVLTIQKTLAKLLLDGLAAVLTTFSGLVLVAFYSSYLLVFVILIVLAVLFILLVLGFGGLRTSIQESIQKYRVVEWLEEMARCHTGFKMNGVPRYMVERTDTLIIDYLLARRAHFAVLFRQALGSYLFQAVASAGILGIGGWLVIERRLTLGQLVASELIVLAVLSSLDKLIRQAEQFYDLLTGLDKVGHVTDLPVEREGGHPLPRGEEGLDVVCRNARFSYRPGVEILSGLNFAVSPGERVSLVGASGAGKSTLAALICGLEEPSHGTVEVGGMEVREISLESLRNAVSLVNDTNEVFNGTIEENIVMGRPHIRREDVRWALDVVQLTEDLSFMPEGIRTPLVSTGKNLSQGQIQRLLIARAIVDRPRLLILDEAFTGIDERTKLAILDRIYAPENRWTIIDISHDAEVVQRSRIVHVLRDGKIVESGPVATLACNPGSACALLFPDLARQMGLLPAEPQNGGVQSFPSPGPPADPALSEPQARLSDPPPTEYWKQEGTR